MARLTWDQKEWRREARRHGAEVMLRLGLMQTAIREAKHWRGVDAERERFWWDRAWGHEMTAIARARKAAHAALQSVAECQVPVGGD